jgi:hypothetical protein
MMMSNGLRNSAPFTGMNAKTVGRLSPRSFPLAAVSRAAGTKLHNPLRLLLAMFATLALVACGGGSSSGGGFLGGGSGDNLTYSLELRVVDSEGNDTTQINATFPARLLVTVREGSRNGPVVSGVVVAATAEFAVITPGNGQALTNPEGVAELGIQAGDVLGADTITVTVEAPAGTVSATFGVEVLGTGLSLGFFDGTTFVNGQIGLSSDSLSFGGSAVVRLAVVDENANPVTAAAQIRLSSACSQSGQATFRLRGDASDGTATLLVTTVDGLADAEYLAGSCEGDDTLRAELVDGNATATASLTIGTRDANYIGFLTADPSEGVGTASRTLIALKGTSGPGRPETARVTFEVLEEPLVLQDGDPQPGEPGYLELAGRNPLAGVNVSFRLTSTLGGTTLSSTSAVSDSQGLVEVVVQAGNVPTTTQIVASFEANDGQGGITTQTAGSNQIVIGTGIPQQNGISVSATAFHVTSARDVDGVESTLTVRMVDRFGNPVRDGTSLSFRTEYGAIDTSCVTGVSNGTRAAAADDTPPATGTCSVLWTSQAPRFPVFNQDLVQTTEDDNSYDCPSHTGVFGPCPDDIGAIRGLRSTVTITAVGEEFFIDANGNGLYDEGEVFENLPEAFTDHNEDGVYTPFAGPQCGFPSTDENCEAAGLSEEFIDFNEDGMYSLNVDPNTGEGVYNGSLCPPEGDGVFCSREFVNVRADAVIVMSAAPQNLQVLAGERPDRPRVATFTLREGLSYDIYIADIFNNAPGAGTVIKFTPDENCAIVVGQEELIVPDLLGRTGAFTTLLQINGNGPRGRIDVFANDGDGGPDFQIGALTCSTQCSDFPPPGPGEDCQEEVGGGP